MMSLVLMLQMDLLFAILAILFMGLIYVGIRRARGGVDDLAAIFHGVMTQATRYLQIRLQKTPPDDWRPSVIMITPRTFDRSSPTQLLEWLCRRYGFGTYLHFIPEMFDTEAYSGSRSVQDQLIRNREDRKGAIFVDTIISPSLTSALAQSLQMPGVSRMDNNSILFEFSVHDPPEVIQELDVGLDLGSVPKMNRMVIRHGENFFGTRKSIHVWLTWHDETNANLMILLAYIILGHKDWKGAEISLFAAYPRSEVRERMDELREWAYSKPYRTSNYRRAVLRHFTKRYNERRDHTSFGGQTPLGRLQSPL